LTLLGAWRQFEPGRAPAAPAVIPQEPRLRKLVLALAFLLAALGPASAAPALEAADLGTWLDGYLPYALKANDIPGAVVTVVKDGRVLLEAGYGLADVGRRKPMDPRRSGIGVGSVSKVFTWTAVMQLVEQGRIDLDADVNRYLDFRIPPRQGRPVTMRQLMTHTPGFEETLKTWLRAGEKPRRLAAWIRAVRPPRRIFAPGEVPAYSNYGAALAGYIVERVSGEPFDLYVARHILTPLGMSHSSFDGPVGVEMALNYGKASDGRPLPASANSQEPSDDPAGSLVSTADDMSRFMLAHLQEGQLDGARILQPATARRMQAVAFSPFPGAQGVALGLFRNDINGRRVLQHDGDLSGFHTDMELLPDDRVGFFLSLNGDGKGAVAGTLGGAYRLRASLFDAFMDRYFPAAPAAPAPTLATARAHARQVAGEYQMSRRPQGNLMALVYAFTHQKITANPDGTITTPPLLDMAHGRPQTWRETAPYQWTLVGGRAQLHMKVVDGEVKAWLPDDLSTGFVLQPLDGPWQAAGNIPVAGLAAGLLALTALSWPLAALMRRRFGRRLEPDPSAHHARRLVQAGVLAGLAYLGGWVLLIAAVALGVPFDAGLDPWIHLVQVLGYLCVPALAIMAWGAVRALGQAGGWWEKAWNLVCVLALADLLYVSFAFSLLSWDLAY
jgi:CubicO group peptidase (beta-lactamase class C family)